MLKQNKKSFGLIMATYLLGIFMGAIDTGIVTPARTIIQNNLQVDEKSGIWMITIYTLSYAASIPIMGKLADRFGRKYIYLVSIFLFGFGSLFCGLSQNFGSFGLLLASRSIQAIGGGGIVPIATAEFGTTFPKEKRGMALGLIGGVYGIANIFGSSAGSAILDLFGKNNWQFIFYVNVPISIFIVIAGIYCLPNNREPSVKKIDIWGISALTVMVLSLLYGLKNIDYFDFKATISSLSVYPFLLAFVLLLPIFILAEKKAEDPVLNLSYFKNLRIVITLILSFIGGFVLMGMIFVPQYCENALKVTTGNGGYFVLILGLFAGVGAPLSGKMIDKFGVKVVLGFGFLTAGAGALFLILVTTNWPNFITVATSLVLTGLGIGFTIGTPMNYMMLDNTEKKEANSALASLSLIRSIGTAVAPAIMVGFIANAGMSVQANVMNLLPSEVSVPTLPYAEELTNEINAMKTDSATKDMLANVDIPDLTSMTTIKIDMNSNSGYKMPDDLIELMKSSDVTTIVANCKTLSERMFGEMTPNIIAKIQSGVQKGIDGINTGITSLDKSITDMQAGYDGISKGIDAMESAVTAQKTALTQLEGVSASMSKMPAGAISGNINLVDMMPPAVKASVPQSALTELADIKTLEQLNAKITGLKAAISTLETKITTNKQSQTQMAAALEGMKAAKTKNLDMVTKMKALSDAVPSAFDTAKTNYLAAIDAKKDALEAEFQRTLNVGFKQVYLTVLISSVLALLILLFYKKNKKVQQEEQA